MGLVDAGEVVSEDAGDCVVVGKVGGVRVVLLLMVLVSCRARLVFKAIMTELNIGFNVRLRVVSGSDRRVFASL